MHVSQKFPTFYQWVEDQGEDPGKTWAPKPKKEEYTLGWITKIWSDIRTILSEWQSQEESLNEAAVQVTALTEEKERLEKQAKADFDKNAELTAELSKQRFAFLKDLKIIDDECEVLKEENARLKKAVFDADAEGRIPEKGTVPGSHNW